MVGRRGKAEWLGGEERLSGWEGRGEEAKWLGGEGRLSGWERRGF